MRVLLPSLLAIVLIFICNHATATEAPTDKKESIIIEVDGDPKLHQAYLQVYHPFIEVIATYDTLFNGLALRADPEKLEKVVSLEFIKAIHPVHTYKAIASTKAIANPKAFSESEESANRVIPSELNTTNYTGIDVKVGVIDTGIDYNHPDLAANYVGGYDVVDLDDDPLETIPSQGMPTLHGTHVAGIIAANGELTGVAPNAAIYAYRALGPGGMGTSVQVIAAMEQAVEDNVDIINLSLGNSINGPDYPTSIAVNRAVDLGVAVVIASGNSGPDEWTVGSPATASKALAVGASILEQTIPFLHEHISNKKIPLTTMHGSVDWAFDKDYPIVHMDEKEVNVNGKIALTKRSDIPFYDKAKQAEENGAIAVVIYNMDKEDFQGSIDVGENPVNIPVVAISKQDGEFLRDQIQTNDYYIDTYYEQTNMAVAPFSSRGPVTRNWQIKPDIVAPGANILSTIPDGYQALNGTSMATPHVTGAIAVIKEAQPGWSNEQIIGALKTTALQIKTEKGEQIEPISQGMGQIQIEEAINTNTIIYNPLLAFGKMDENRETNTLSFTIENKTNEPQNYFFEIPTKQKGLQWKLPKAFTLGKNESKTLPIQLNVTTAQLEETIHQGWLTLNEEDKQYKLAYAFVNKTAKYPKAMGFDLSLKRFPKDVYGYSLYVTEQAKRVEVNLYNPDTLVYEGELLELTELEIGLNEGDIKRSELLKSGYYKALITVQLESGEYESHETDVVIE